MSMEQLQLIEELPDLKIGWCESYKCLDEPLLEYVWEVANHFVSYEGDISIAPAKFVNRYITSKLTPEENVLRLKEMGVDKSLEDFMAPNFKKMDMSFKDKFLENEDLQNTIKAFGLDVSKLWYLLLFVHDYIEDFSTSLKKSEVQDIGDFVDSLSNCSGITLTLTNEKKKNFDTSEKNTIEFVQLALDYYIKTYNDIINRNLSPKDKLKLLKEIGLNHFLEHGQAIDFENKTNLAISFKKWKFADMFQFFLKDRKADKKKLSHINVKVSTDKMMFISRLIYTVGYDGKRYNEEYDSDGNKNRMLSNLLRKYKNEDFPDFANHYYLF
jgi:hypothetical protein